MLGRSRGEYATRDCATMGPASCPQMMAAGRGGPDTVCRRGFSVC